MVAGFNGMLAKILLETPLFVKRKPLIHLVLFIDLLLVTSLACQAVTDLFIDDYANYDEGHEYENEIDSESYAEDDSGGNEESPLGVYTPPSDLTEPTTDNVCPVVTENILSAATQVEDESDAENAEEEEAQYLVSYLVSGDQINDPYYEEVTGDLQGYQDDDASHQKIWGYFITLIPADKRTQLKEFMIMTDGESNDLAAVAQTTYDPNFWSLEIDIVDSDDTLNLTYTLIHEYAHLLTLGPDQVTPSVVVFNNPDNDNIYYDEASACPVYFPGEGCSQANSYINAFFNQFWADIHEEWQDINLIEDNDAYYDALDEFYYKYEERFVTDYAATNPEEDIAEAFTFFVLSPRPNGDTIAEEKILFFYDYPELVDLRDEIVSGVCSLSQ